MSLRETKCTQKDPYNKAVTGKYENNKVLTTEQPRKTASGW